MILTASGRAFTPLYTAQNRKAGADDLLDLNAGFSASHDKKKQKKSRSEKKDKPHKGQVYGSVSSDPVLVAEHLAQLVELSVVPEAVGGPISISAVSVALCTDDRDNGDGEKSKKNKKQHKKQHKKEKQKAT